jgi:hypothetical protein
MASSQKAAFFRLTAAGNLSYFYSSSVKMLICAISEDSYSFEKKFLPEDGSRKFHRNVGI